MSQMISLDESDRERIETELRQCQARVVQTLVPTILALGLIALAESARIRDISLGCAFAVLFSSSLYVASLSYKIIRNAEFLKVFASPEIGDNKICWEYALSAYRKTYGNPLVIHSETTTAATIYSVLSLAFFFIFYRVNLIASIVGTVVLLFVSFGIFLTYKRSNKVTERWEKLKATLEEKHGNRNEKA